MDTALARWNCASTWGNFYGSGAHEEKIRKWARRQRVGAGPIGVYGLSEVVGAVRQAAARTEYRDNPVLVTMKVLAAADLLTEPMGDA
jgi:hypothetical protein